MLSQFNICSCSEHIEAEKENYTYLGAYTNLYYFFEKNVFQRQCIKLTPFPLLLGFARNDDHNVEFIIFKFCEGGLSYLTQFLLIMVVICNGATKYQTHFT